MTKAFPAVLDTIWRLRYALLFERDVAPTITPATVPFAIVVTVPASLETVIVPAVVSREMRNTEPMERGMVLRIVTGVVPLVDATYGKNASPRFDDHFGCHGPKNVSMIWFKYTFCVSTPS